MSGKKTGMSGDNDNFATRVRKINPAANFTRLSNLSNRNRKSI